MSMKALAFKTTGDEQQLDLHTVPRPTLLADDVLVHIRGFAINPADVAVRAGKINIIPNWETSIIGWDGSGVIEAVGSEVTAFKAGDEVFWSGVVHRPGSYAEYIAVNHQLVAHKPKTVDHAVAASMPLVTLTAWQALEDGLGLKIPITDEEIQVNASKTIFITVGAGGVGSIATQLAKKLFKIGTVITNAGRKESIEWCKQYGADIIIDRTKDWKTQLAEHDVKGVDYVLVNSAWEGIVDDILAIINYGGKICGISHTQASVNLGVLMAKALSVSFVHMQSKRHNENLSLLAKLVDEGTIKPWVGKKYEKATPETIREGHKLQATGTMIGKITYVADF